MVDLRMFLAYLLVSSTFANQSAINRVQKQCFEKNNWAQKSCDLLYNEQYIVSGLEAGFGVFFNLVDGPLFDAVAEAEILIDELVEGVESERRAHRKEGAKARNHLVGKLKEKSKFLSACQKACLVKCVSSHYINYRTIAAGKKNFSDEDLYYNAWGECSEFADIANDLSKELGLEVRTVTNLREKHAYNEFKIGENWFNFEPQHDTCEFYISDREDLYGEKGYSAEAINDSDRNFNFSTLSKKYKKSDFSKALNQ